MPLPPGPPYPATVQTLLYLARPESFLDDCHRRYGDMFTIKTLLFGTEVCVVRPETIKTIFTGDPDVLRAGEANAALEPLVGRRSVLLLDGAEHLRQRRLMMPPFHGERMLAYARTMREVTEDVLGRWPIGKPFVLHAQMQRITLDVILRTIFGVDEAAELDELRASITALLDRGSTPLATLATIPPLRKDLWGFSPWAMFQRAVKRVDDLIYRQIARRRSGAGHGAPRDDVLSLLLEARDDQGNAMTDVELRDELMTLLAAGHETTATELCWAFDRILREPRVLGRLEKELADAGSGGGAPALERLPYVEATLKEVLRLRPVIPAVGRRLQRPMVLEGYEIPAGTLLVPGLWITHRLPDVYAEPEAFRPERFLDTKPDPYAWLPFGGGIRRCLGMAFALFEMKVVLATILTHVRLRLARPGRETKVALRGFTHAPAGGVPVIAERRVAQGARRAPVTESPTARP